MSSLAMDFLANSVLSSEGSVAAILVQQYKRTGVTRSRQKAQRRL